MVPIDGFKVLIGANGVGKSTLIEAFELLRKAATEPSFVESLNTIHGGAPALLGSQSEALAVGARLADEGGEFDYILKLEKSYGGLAVAHENLFALGSSGANELLFNRTETKTTFLAGSAQSEISLDRSRTVLSTAGPGSVLDPRVGAVREALARIDIHLPFDLRPSWARASRRDSVAGPRASNLLTPARGLDRHGANLANAYFEMINRDNWKDTLEYVQLGLGDAFRRVFTEADPGGGYHAFGSTSSITASCRPQRFPMGNSPICRLLRCGGST